MVNGSFPEICMTKDMLTLETANILIIDSIGVKNIRVIYTTVYTNTSH